MGLGASRLSFTVLDPSKVPEGEVPRWAVLGRSNVGKSSLLNALVHPAEHFRAGRTAGVTRGLIGVRVRLGKSEASEMELVDLPGFGFSEGGSIVGGDAWGHLAEALREKSHARGLQWVWLVDPRRKPNELELNLRHWLNREPYLFVFTKADQVKASGRREAEKNWSALVQGSTEKPFWASALSGEGMDTLGKSARGFVRFASTLVLALCLAGSSFAAVSEMQVLARVGSVVVTDRRAQIEYFLEDPSAFPAEGRAAASLTKAALDQALSRVLTQVMASEENRILGIVQVRDDDLKEFLEDTKKKMGATTWRRFLNDYETTEADLRPMLVDKILLRKAIAERIRSATEAITPDVQNLTREERARKALDEWLKQLRSRYRVQYFKTPTPAAAR